MTTLAIQDRRAVAAASQCEFREGWSFKGKPEPIIGASCGQRAGRHGARCDPKRLRRFGTTAAKGLGNLDGGAK